MKYEVPCYKQEKSTAYLKVHFFSKKFENYNFKKFRVSL